MDDARINRLRTRWAAVGAAVAITLGAGGIGIVNATQPAGAVAFVPITPCRIIDTRPGSDNVGAKSSPLGPNETVTISAHGDPGNCVGIPATATGLSLNVTTVGASELTFLTIWPTGQPKPLASSLNPAPGQPPTPNAVTTALSPTGQFNVYNLQGSVHVLADVNGYYADHHHDDRYYTKNQINARVPVKDSITLDAFGFVSESGSFESEGSCLQNTEPAQGMWQTVPLTTGSTITSLTVRTRAPSAQNYYIILWRRLASGSIQNPSLIPITQRPTGPGHTTHEVALPTPALIGSGESVFVRFQDFTTLGEAHLCSVTVHFTRPG